MIWQTPPLLYTKFNYIEIKELNLNTLQNDRIEWSVYNQYEVDISDTYYIVSVPRNQFIDLTTLGLF